MKRYVLLMLTIDTECDKGPGWEIHRPLCFSSVTKGIPEVLSPLFERFQVTPTYLLSPEVLQDAESVQVLASIGQCELGAHLHGEFIAPCDDPASGGTHTPQFLYSPEVERQKLANLTGLFESRFGYRPLSFRAGRFGISRHTLRILADLGYRVDSSVTPFWSHDFEGRGRRSGWGAPLQPFFPRWDDPFTPGRASVLEVPVTVLNPALAGWPGGLLRRMDNRTRWPARLLRRLGCQDTRTLWLRPHRTSAVEMQLLTTRLLERFARGPLVLNMMYHSVEIIPGASPYAQTQEEVQALLDAQAQFFAWLYEHYNVRSLGLGASYSLFHGKKHAADS